MAFVLTNQLVAQHGKGDLLCHAGWCSNSDGTPVPYVHPDCGGIVHGDLLDHVTNPDPHWLVAVGCDKCDFRASIVQRPSDSFEHGVQPGLLSAPASVPSVETKRTPAKKAAKARAR